MEQKQNLENMMLCVWKDMANNRLSTTFEQVREFDTDHDLWKCKYNCSGYDMECNGYRSKIELEKYKHE